MSHQHQQRCSCRDSEAQRVPFEVGHPEPWAVMSPINNDQGHKTQQSQQNELDHLDDIFGNVIRDQQLPMMVSLSTRGERPGERCLSLTGRKRVCVGRSQHPICRT